MPTYPYDSKSQDKGSVHSHHKLLNMLIILVVALVIFGGLYIWSTSTTSVKNESASAVTDVRSQVAEILRNSKVTVTQKQINDVAAQLSASKVVVTDAQKKAVADQLRAK